MKVLSPISRNSLLGNWWSPLPARKGRAVGPHETLVSVRHGLASLMIESPKQRGVNGNNRVRVHMSERNITCVGERHQTFRASSKVPESEGGIAPG